MTRLFLFLIIAGLPSMGAAMRVSLFPIVIEQRYIENEDGDLYFQKIDSFAAGLTFDFYQLGIETNKWSSQSGTSLIGFKNSVSELNTTHLFKMGTSFDWLYFYSGFGLGRYESELVSQFNGVSTTTKSGQTLFTSGILSIQAIFWYIHIDTELKILFAKDFRPQPTPELSVKLGANF